MGVGLMLTSNLALTLAFLAPSARSGSTERVAITGEVDLLSVGELERWLRRVIAESRCRTIVLDLGGVEFLAAPGVSGVLAAVGGAGGGRGGFAGAKGPGFPAQGVGGVG